VAHHALDLIGTAQASSGWTASLNIQHLGHRLRTDLAGLNQRLLAQTERIVGGKHIALDRLFDTMGKGFSTSEAVSGASLAVHAVGFARVERLLHGVGDDAEAMDDDIADQRQQLISIQEVAQARSENLVQFASRTLQTQERILETLASSRTVEAQQLIRQGWENLLNGFEDDAFSRFVTSLEYDNTVYLAHAVLAHLYEGRSDIAAAEEHHKRASCFAGARGARVAAYGHIQYASFLDRTFCPARALAEVRAALLIDGIDKLTRGSWCLYEAELLARLGDTPGAVASARRAIAEDDALFLAVMASEHLERAQPALSKMLVAIDQARRTRVFVQLEDAARQLERLAKLTSPDIAQPLRTQAVALLEKTLLAHFHKLPRLVEDASWLAGTSRRTLQSALDTAREAVRVRRDDVAALARTAPTAPPTTGIEALAVIGGLGAFMTGIFLGVIVVGICERANNGPWPLFLCVVAFATAFATPIIAFFVVVSRTQAELRREDEALLDAAMVSWQTWRQSAEAAASDFARRKYALRAELLRAELDPEMLTHALSSLDSIALPPFATHPPWHEGSSRPKRQLAFN
jgi:tetratricopeptide (TPR) repeat protein